MLQVTQLNPKKFQSSQIKFLIILIPICAVMILPILYIINQAFKPLDEIDLIKTYIFKNIDEDKHEGVLARWSELIKGTDDKLEDYLKTYISTNILLGVIM